MSTRLLSRRISAASIAVLAAGATVAFAAPAQAAAPAGTDLVSQVCVDAETVDLTWNYGPRGGLPADETFSVLSVTLETAGVYTEVSGQTVTTHDLDGSLYVTVHDIPIADRAMPLLLSSEIGRAHV